MEDMRKQCKENKATIKLGIRGKETETETETEIELNQKIIISNSEGFLYSGELIGCRYYCDVPVIEIYSQHYKLQRIPVSEITKIAIVKDDPFHYTTEDGRVFELYKMAYVKVMILGKPYWVYGCVTCFDPLKMAMLDQSYEFDMKDVVCMKMRRPDGYDDYDFSSPVPANENKDSWQGRREETPNAEDKASGYDDKSVQPERSKSNPDDEGSKMTNEMLEELKEFLFLWGKDAIEDFLDMDLSGYEDKDMIEKLVDEAASQMPEDILLKYYKEYEVKKSDEKKDRPENKEVKPFPYATLHVRYLNSGRVVDVQINTRKELLDLLENHLLPSGDLIMDGYGIVRIISFE